MRSHESDVVLATLPAEVKDLQLAASFAARSDVNMCEGEELEAPLANLHLKSSE